MSEFLKKSITANTGCFYNIWSDYWLGINIINSKYLIFDPVMDIIVVIVDFMKSLQKFFMADINHTGFDWIIYFCALNALFFILTDKMGQQNDGTRAINMIQNVT